MITAPPLCLRQKHGTMQVKSGLAFSCGGAVSFGDYLVRDVMTSPVITVDPSAALLDAALLLRGNNIRHLPVMQNGRLVGLLSDRDIQRSAPSRLLDITEDRYNEIFASTTVESIMVRDPETVLPETPLRDALEVMLQSRFGCLPVMENGELVGILTRGDFLVMLQRLLGRRETGGDPSQD